MPRIASWSERFCLIRNQYAMPFLLTFIHLSLWTNLNETVKPNPNADHVRYKNIWGQIMPSQCEIFGGESRIPPVLLINLRCSAPKSSRLFNSLNIVESAKDMILDANLNQCSILYRPISPWTINRPICCYRQIAVIY